MVEASSILLLFSDNRIINQGNHGSPDGAVDEPPGGLNEATIFCPSMPGKHRDAPRVRPNDGQATVWSAVGGDPLRDGKLVGCLAW